MAKKEFTYRGKTLDQLLTLDIKEFAQLLPSKYRRSINRGYTEAEKKFMNKIAVKNNVKTHCRTIIIIPLMVGKTVLIHRGNKFEKLEIVAEMIGHRLGEFALTRKRTSHSSPGVGATKSNSSVSIR